MSNYTKEDGIRFFKLGCDDDKRTLPYNFMYGETEIFDVPFKQDKINGLARLVYDEIENPKLIMFYGNESYTSDDNIFLTDKEYIELKNYYFRINPEFKKETKNYNKINSNFYRWLFKKIFLRLPEIEQTSILSALYHRHDGSDDDVPSDLKQENDLIKTTCGYLAQELMK